MPKEFLQTVVVIQDGRKTLDTVAEQKLLGSGGEQDPEAEA